MVGDRVQIGDTRGDVIDIGLLRTTLLETGNWVRKDLYNGRIVRVPNSALLKGSVFNYSQGFPFVWDQIKVAFTTGSDFQFAKDMLTRVAREAVGDYLLEAQASWKVVSDYYETVSPPLEPTSRSRDTGNLEFDVVSRALHKRTAHAGSVVHEDRPGSCQEQRPAPVVLHADPGRNPTANCSRTAATDSHPGNGESGNPVIIV